MATLLEFNELPVGSNVSVTTTDRGVVSGDAVDATAIGGQFSFATVARASTSRMLDASAALCAGLPDQAKGGVSSVASGWHWDDFFPSGLITDNITTCRPTAWAATGLDGAFVRDLQATHVTRTSYRIDSTALDNEGIGDALDPLQTDAELDRRLGVNGLYQLTEPFTVTWVQSPSTVTNLGFALLPGSSLSFLGVPSTSTPVVLTAVTLQNRSAPQMWEVTGPGLGAADVGKTIEISASVTPGNIGAYACVVADLGGGTLRVSPFGVRTITLGATFFVNITPVIGDSVVIHTVPTVQIGRVTIASNTSGLAPVASPVQNCMVVDLLTLRGAAAGLANAGAGIQNIGAAVLLFRVWLEGMRLGGQSLGQGSFRAAGSGTKTSFSMIAGGQQFLGVSCGFISSLQFVSGAVGTLQQDCLFQASAMTAQNDAFVFEQGSGFVGRASAPINVNPRGVIQQFGAVPSWGSSTAGFGILAQSGGLYTYATKPTINSGLGVGRETSVGGTDKLLVQVPYLEGANGAGIVFTA